MALNSCRTLSTGDPKDPVINFFEFWLATMWMTMVTEGEQREDYTVYELAKENKNAPPTWWTVPPMASRGDPPPPPGLTSSVAETMVALLSCESFAHATVREMAVGRDVHSSRFPASCEPVCSRDINRCLFQLALEPDFSWPNHRMSQDLTFVTVSGWHLSRLIADST